MILITFHLARTILMLAVLIEPKIVLANHEHLYTLFYMKETLVFHYLG